MSYDNMLGKLVRQIATVPGGMYGTLYDLAKRLSSESEGFEYCEELKRFLRKEPTWVSGEKQKVFHPKIFGSLKQKECPTRVIIGPTYPGRIYDQYKKTIRIVPGVFNSPYYSSIVEPPRSEQEVEIYDLTEERTFAEIFDLGKSLSWLCFTHAQIGDFCSRRRAILGDPGKTTLFLFNSSTYMSADRFEVALVTVLSQGELRLEVASLKEQYKLHMTKSYPVQVVLPKMGK